MGKSRYSDSQIANGTQKLFLETADIAVKFLFEPSEQIYFKRRLLEEVREVWGTGGFLRPISKRVDFEVRFRDTNLIEVVHKDRRAKQFYLTFQRDFTSHRVATHYHTSLPVLQLLLKEVFAFLLRKDGFLLHGAGCLGRAGNLKLFLAPPEGGKTTVATLLSGGKDIELFCDDILIARKMENCWRFFSPPFIEKHTLPVKREAENVELFFVKKSKKAAKKEIQDSKEVLPLLLGQIWSKTGSMDKKTLRNAIMFVRDNKFYWLNSVLDAKKLRKTVYED